MSAIPGLPLATWMSFSTIAEKLHVGDPVVGSAYVFRGHSDVSWTLDSSLHRAATNDRRSALPDAAEMLRMEGYLLDQFRAAAPNYLPGATFAATRANLDWWLLMRHYGVPTRILDWTASFYVAAYFAVSRHPDKDGVVYCVHVHTLNRAMEAAHGPAAKFQTSDDVYLNPDAPPVINVVSRKTALLDRMIAQQGCFMVCRNVVGDFEQILSSEIPKVADPAQETLRKFIVPAASKAAFMRHLRAMNVTASSLFPGLDGIGRHLDETVRRR